MNKLNRLLAENEQANAFFHSLGKDQQMLMIRSSDSVQSVADMKKILYQHYTNSSAEF